MLITRKQINAGMEKRIVTGMIISKQFTQRLFPIIDLNYFDNTHCREVVKWCINHFDKYEDVPHDTIQDIYKKQQQRLSDEDADLIAKMLKQISDDFGDKEFRHEYYLREAQQYFEKKQMEIMAHNVSVLLEEGKIAEARNEIKNTNRVSLATSVMTDLTDLKNINLVLEKQSEIFFQFPKALGRFMGNLDPGWLVAISGQFKRGKTWFLQEFAINALLSRLNVCFFSLEMTEKQMYTRIYQRLVPTSPDGKEIYPCFDCKKNQDNSCNKKERTNIYRLLDADGNKPVFKKTIPYKVCTACQGTSDFEMDTWFKLEDLPNLDSSLLKRKINIIKKNYGKRVRLGTYPRFSANLSDIKADIDKLKNVEGFIPDVIIVDYADILKPETKDIGVQKEDLTWMALARLAGEQKALVVTATQVTKDALGADTIKQKHTARWVGKLGHVDAMYTLNQTDEEKSNGVMRIGTMVHRHYDFSESKQCTILQNLNVGQALLDSEM